MTKDERRIIAENHFEYTQDAYINETNRSIANSVVYDEYKQFVFRQTTNKPEITVEDLTSEQAVRKMGTHCCVLNFASFTRPGGGFIKGAIAQEEALCHASNLYDILVKFTHLYNENYTHYMNNGLYKDWAIWTPDVCFIYNPQSPHFEEIVEADVITCPAPNAWYAKKMPNAVQDGVYNKVLYNRCKYVLDIAEKHGVTKLILGAFGCGVFANKPHDVATTFKKLLTSGSYSFEHVMFAIPNNSRDNNYNAFKEVF